MCGFAGFLGGRWYDGGQEADIRLKQMNDRISYRGPDSDGYWCDSNSRIALGHRRLAIIDLSPSGHQPMASVDGRFIIAFNGEIYNHRSLRSSLEKKTIIDSRAWRGHSDTESLLAGFSAWGIRGTIERCEGMFAIAVWDRETRTLTLIRDRLGEKPLYYGWQGSGHDATFLFGSELKALKAHPAFSAEIDRAALSLFMRQGYVPTPYSIYKGINKLPAGTMLNISMHSRDPDPIPYWSVLHVASCGILKPFKNNSHELVSELDSLLSSSVKQQMMADVPIGAFLSGGIDSSTVVALMQAQSSRAVNTFTIGFHEVGYDEATHAKLVAKHLGTNHTELYVSSQQARDVIPRLPSLYCEPFSDSSQIPTFLVSQLARQHVSVSLSGDGGDELFAGYNRYVMGQKFWGKLSHLPLRLRQGIAQLITGMSPQFWNLLSVPIQGMLPPSLAQTNIGDKLHKGAGVIAARTPSEFYQLLISHWSDPSELVIGAAKLPDLLTNVNQQLDMNNFIHQMMALDMLTFLPDDILTKVDRASMGVSLETRVPFLDHRVVEFAWRIPLDYKICSGVGKWILRQVLYKYVPKKLIERPKMGFGVPIDIWLRGPLRDWAEELLSESRLQREGYLNATPIRQKWDEHLSGRRNWQAQLWTVLMFQAWLEANHL
jgi:asparagine synthase (glutamine-hydrolysing)